MTVTNILEHDIQRKGSGGLFSFHGSLLTLKDT